MFAKFVSYLRSVWAEIELDAEECFRKAAPAAPAVA